jgi:hypothetical protein
VQCVCLDVECYTRQRVGCDAFVSREDEEEGRSRDKGFEEVFGGGFGRLRYTDIYTIHAARYAALPLSHFVLVVAAQSFLMIRIDLSNESSRSICDHVRLTSLFWFEVFAEF